jgi:hypothetical protein
VVDGKILAQCVEEFEDESLSGAYWAPFNVNSKNYRHIPAETTAWFECMAETLEDACRLGEQGDHVHAGSMLRSTVQVGRGA